MKERIVGSNGFTKYETGIEIVRCRDCKHWSPNAIDGVCTRLRFFTNYMPSDGFCSRGERREQ